MFGGQLLRHLWYFVLKQSNNNHNNNNKTHCEAKCMNDKNNSLT